MKQLKFLTNISLDSKAIWYKGCIYQVLAEDEGMYKLICEDLIPRGIDKRLSHKMYEVIEIQEEKPKVKEAKIEKEVVKEKPKTTRKPRKTTEK